jgi:hypothetical protein
LSVFVGYVFYHYWRPLVFAKRDALQVQSEVGRLFHRVRVPLRLRLILMEYKWGMLQLRIRVISTFLECLRELWLLFMGGISLANLELAIRRIQGFSKEVWLWVSGCEKIFYLIGLMGHLEELIITDLIV